MKTYSMKASEVEKKWLIVDAKDVVLGRLATIVATRCAASTSQLTHRTWIAVITLS